MKKYILFPILLFLLSLTAIAQKNIVKVGIVASGGINAGVQYERLLTRNIAILGQVGYAQVSNYLNIDSSTGIGFYSEGRYYFSKNKDLMEGWHGGVYLHYLDTNDTYDYEANRLAFGIAGGYQWVFNSQLTLDAFLGGGLMTDSDKYSTENSGLYPLLGLNLGYNF